MKEDFLLYLWKFCKFDTLELQTSSNQPITILHPGQYMQRAGPDFFNAQLIIDSQKWAGNVEIHVKSSDWYLHRHEEDPAYESVILHVVWQHDTEIYRRDNHPIPVLELQNYTDQETLHRYQNLLLPKSWIYCERQLFEVDDFIKTNWLERLLVERLERKSKSIMDLAESLGKDWEALLFCLLAKNFGLNTNGAVFLKLAQTIPFVLIRKESSEHESLEALFFGKAGLLHTEKEDWYLQQLKSRFDSLQTKYKIPDDVMEPLQFFKLRPDNFPTIRLSQLAALYHLRQNLFSEVIAADSMKQLYALFQVSVSGYWQTHYLFDRESPKKNKSLSKSFIDLIVINTIVPLRFAYAKSLGKDESENAMELLRQISAENNTVVRNFGHFGMPTKHAFHSQSLLQLKAEYCNQGRCLDCAIGIALLRTA